MHRNIRSSFSILELSISIVIIALAIFVIITSRSLIISAKINKIYKDKRDMDTLVQIFYNTFDCLPGDCKISDINQKIYTQVPSSCFNLQSDYLTPLSTPVITTGFNTGEIDSPAKRTCAFYELQALEPQAFNGTATNTLASNINSLIGIHNAWAIGVKKLDLSNGNDPVILQIVQNIIDSTTSNLNNQIIANNNQISTNNTDITNKLTISFWDGSSSNNYHNRDITAMFNYCYPGGVYQKACISRNIAPAGSSSGVYLQPSTNVVTNAAVSVINSYVYQNGGQTQGVTVSIGPTWYQAFVDCNPSDTLAPYSTTQNGTLITNQTCQGVGGGTCKDACSIFTYSSSPNESQAVLDANIASAKNLINNNAILRTDITNLNNQITQINSPEYRIQLYQQIAITASIGNATQPVMQTLETKAMWDLRTINYNNQPSSGFYPYEINNNVSNVFSNWNKKIAFIARSSTNNNDLTDINDMSAFSANFAQKMDTKYDDGNPYTGNIVAGKNTSQINSNIGCTTAASTTWTGVVTNASAVNYSKSKDLENGCVLSFLIHTGQG